MNGVYGCNESSDLAAMSTNTHFNGTSAYNTLNGPTGGAGSDSSACGCTGTGSSDTAACASPTGVGRGSRQVRATLNDVA